MRDNIKEEIRRMLKWKKSKSYYANKLGISEEEVERLIMELKDAKGDILDSLDTPIIYEGYWEKCPTPEEVIERYNIDPKKWKLSNIWIKERKGGYFCSSHFVRVKPTIQDIETTIDKIFSDILERIKDYRPNIEELKRDLNFGNLEGNGQACLLLNLTDIHIDKKALKENNDIHKRVALIKEIVKNFVKQAKSLYYEIEHCVLVIGSDLFDTDTYFNTTTKGTRQEDPVVSWDVSYVIVFDLFVYIIYYLSSIAKSLDVIFLQGNHDRTKSFYLVYPLSKYLSNLHNVNFDISTLKRKCVLYKDVFIGFHHGDCKISNLPLIFAKEFSDYWGKAKYHEIHVGHIHFYEEKEISGVRIKQYPSLAPDNDWSDMMNYVNQVKSAIAILYDSNNKRRIELEQRI